MPTRAAVGAWEVATLGAVLPERAHRYRIGDGRGGSSARLVAQIAQAYARGVFVEKAGPGFVTKLKKPSATGKHI